MIAWAVIGTLSVGTLVCTFILAWSDDRGARALRAVEQDLQDRLAVGLCEWLP